MYIFLKAFPICHSRINANSPGDQRRWEILPTTKNIILVLFPASRSGFCGGEIGTGVGFPTLGIIPQMP
jgi:hypothetical protein